MKQVSGVIISLAFLICASAAQAVPIVSVDTDPTIVVGNPLTVDIVIEGVDASEPLGAFELDLTFDPTILDPTSVVSGGFLLPPVLTNDVLGAMTIEIQEVSLFGVSGAVGAGTLATILFDTIGLGTSPLGIYHVKLFVPGGFSFVAFAVNSGSVTVTPEPSTMLLLASGLAGLVFFRWRRKAV